MITKEQQDLLRSEREQHNNKIVYPQDNSRVTSCPDAERIGALNYGDKILAQQSHQLQQDMAFKAREGFAKAQHSQAASVSNDTAPTPQKVNSRVEEIRAQLSRPKTQDLDRGR